MTVSKILVEPDPILRKKCLMVDEVNKDVQKLMNDMLETMYDAPGIGLAAIQIGILKRVVVIDLSKDVKKKEPLFFANPEIIFKSENKSTYEEGCLSIPEQFAEIERSSECHIKYLDYYGKNQTLKAKGLLATCIQHEIDHLNGILFIDYLSKLKKTMIIKKLSKQKKSERVVV
jgi:peptide deformylase